MTPASWTMLVVLSMLWGGSFFFTEIVLETFAPLTVVALRVGLAAAFLLAVVAVRGRRGRRALVRPEHAGLGLLSNALPFLLIVTAQTEITSGLASILNAATPVWALIVAHLFTSDEKLTPRRAMGALIGLGGVVLLIGPAALGSVGTAVLAQLAVVAATISYGFAGTYGKCFKADDPIETATAQLVWATVLVTPLALAVDRPWQLPAPGADAVLAILGFAIPSTALAYILYYRILQQAGATNVMLVTLLVPVSAVLLGTVFLGEQLAPAHLLGMAVIAAGLTVIDGRLGRCPGRLRRRRAPLPLELSRPGGRLPRRPVGHDQARPGDAGPLFRHHRMRGRFGGRPGGGGPD